MPHRFAYEALRDAIPTGLQIDHLCRTRLCVNPWHMEPVTARVNVRRSLNPAAANARRTECVNGHPFTETNTYTPPGGRGRFCRTCRRLRNRVYQAPGYVAGGAS
ncbi:HNH endonuclease [Streptomyces sp. NPDC052000]|uniref:HNH endonuclease n=1 Tax=Streptomyces sp. NPDC052000 TaxID=3155676 RepID=UPI00344D4EB6